MPNGSCMHMYPLGVCHIDTWNRGLNSKCSGLIIIDSTQESRFVFLDVLKSPADFLGIIVVFLCLPSLV